MSGDDRHCETHAGAKVQRHPEGWLQVTRPEHTDSYGLWPTRYEVPSTKIRAATMTTTTTRGSRMTGPTSLMTPTKTKVGTQHYRSLIQFGFLGISYYNISGIIDNEREDTARMAPRMASSVGAAGSVVDSTSTSAEFKIPLNRLLAFKIL